MSAANTVVENGGRVVLLAFALERLESTKNKKVRTRNDESIKEGTGSLKSPYLPYFIS